MPSMHIKQLNLTTRFWSLSHIPNAFNKCQCWCIQRSLSLHLQPYFVNVTNEDSFIKWAHIFSHYCICHNSLIKPMLMYSKEAKWLTFFFIHTLYMLVTITQWVSRRCCLKNYYLELWLPSFFFLSFSFFLYVLTSVEDIRSGLFDEPISFSGADLHTQSRACKHPLG